ncbi:N-acetylated-alpha-linked acidic dipeptidase 2-like [Montipora capricornis]|uniref:N-acetylated-alpha-linked acidic dipeptidase 2-like n=1 Tax=Montipora capricornis TaxID=246305 RepID=UPI0035F13335
MDSSNISTRGIKTDYISSEGGPREDFPVEDEYIYDDYDSEPLLTSQVNMELSRQYQGRKYSLIRKDEAEANTIIPMRWRFSRCVLKAFVVLILFGIGGLCGYFITVNYINSCKKDRLFIVNHLHISPENDINRISSKSIGEFLRYFSKLPHLSGSNVSWKEASYIQKKWKDYGFDKVELKKYDVLFSYPERTGTVSINAGDGTMLFTAQELDQSEKHLKVLSTFNAYSRSGNVSAHLVYVNYATLKDFKRLREMNIKVSGHIIIAKYGKTYVRDKAKIAAAKGAVGLILYTDPNDHTTEADAFTYHHNWWQPPTGVQRRTLPNLKKGVPQTPGHPSKDKMNMRPEIPVHPVSYKDAYRFLKLLTTNQAPKDWQGDLMVTYNITMAKNDKRYVHLGVKMKLERKPAYSVIGIINGNQEPDRLVLLGNHRDGFGATDASSGMATLMEISRQLGKMRREGWRPHKSLVLCSWGAEEYGIFGSTGWTEDFAYLLSNRAVAYVNVDSAVTGNYSLSAKSSPLLDLAFMNATKKIYPPTSTAPTETLYEDWKNKSTDKNNPGLPKVERLGTTSDHNSLYFRLGVPSISFQYAFDESKRNPVFSHPMLDNFHWMKDFVDRRFEYHRTVAQLWLSFGLTLADQPLLPFDTLRYAEELVYFAKDIKTKYETILSFHNITLEPLLSAIKKFSKAASAFQSHLTSIDNSNPLTLRMANDRLMQLERSFSNPHGLLGRPHIGNVVYGPTSPLTISSFPGLVEARFSAQHSDEKDWDQVKKTLCDIVFHIESACHVMLFESL